MTSIESNRFEIGTMFVQHKTRKFQSENREKKNVERYRLYAIW